LLEEALYNFTEAIKLDGRMADFYHNRGFTYRKLENYALAIEDYTKALQLDKSHFKAYYNRAYCYDKLCDYVQAERDYLKALSFKPDNINILHYLGCLFEKKGGKENIKKA
jgi:tetratricopeptide (TPR) repeat protein